MLKKTIKYTDFNGVEREEDFFFNLTRGELAEMELEATNKENQGGLHDLLQSIVDSQDGRQIIDAFKMILKKAYGQKSEDGRRFIKTDQMFEEFLQTQAYSELFLELVTDANSASAFINGVVPADLSEKVQAQIPGAPQDFRPAQ